MKSKLLLALLTLAIPCAAPLAYSSSQGTRGVTVKFPPGAWTLRHPVISRLGLAEAPLQITGVTGDVKQGGTITAIRLKNNSGKAVTAVKFAWYLFRDQEPRKILQRGESPVLGVTGFLDGSSKVVDYPIVSFGDIYRPLVKDGKLTGDFVLEVAVSESPTRAVLNGRENKIKGRRIAGMRRPVTHSTLRLDSIPSIVVLTHVD